MSEQTWVWVVMVGQRDAGGITDGRQKPVAVFADEGDADDFAEKQMQRPPGNGFWMPPAHVKVIEVPFWDGAPA